jgi:hypothetical protein
VAGFRGRRWPASCCSAPVTGCSRNWFRRLGPAAGCSRGEARAARPRGLYRHERGVPLARTPRRDGRPARRPRPLAEGRIGLTGPGGLERVGPSGSTQEGRIRFFSFFSEILSSANTIPENVLRH